MISRVMNTTSSTRVSAEEKYKQRTQATTTTTTATTGTTDSRKFTSLELSELRHSWNAHVAYEGNVRKANTASNCIYNANYSLVGGKKCFHFFFLTLTNEWNGTIDLARYYLQVYDVSSFVSRHPGGADLLLSGAGRDITQVFKSYHNTDVFERYIIIYLLDLDLPLHACLAITTTLLSLLLLLL